MKVNSDLPDITKHFRGASTLKAIRDRKPLHFLNLAEATERRNTGYGGYSHNLHGFLEDGRRVNVLVHGMLLYFDVLIGDMEDYLGPLRPSNRAIDRGPLEAIAPGDSTCEFADGAEYPEYGHVDASARLSDPAIRAILYRMHARELSNVENTFRAMQQTSAHSVAKYERLLRFPADAFQQFPSLYVRAYFSSAHMRTTNLANIRGLKYKTYSDDTSAGTIPFMLSRAYGFSLAGWNTIERYALMNSEETEAQWDRPGAIIRLTCNVADLHKADIGAMDAESVKRSLVSIHDFDLETMTMRFDRGGQRAVPLPNQDADMIAMIGGTFSWSDSAVPWYSFCITLVDYPRDSPAFDADRGEFSAFVCRDEAAVLRKYIEILKRVKPGIINGFNSASYDLPFVVAKCKKHGLLTDYYDAISCDNEAFRSPLGADSILRYNYEEISVKIKMDDMVNGFNLNAPGMLFTDTMIIMRKMYPNDEKWNLNYFLNKLKLAPKDDMPYTRMFTLIENGLAVKRSGAVPAAVEGQDLAHVMLYCTRDAAACSEIWMKAKVMLSMRGIAEMAFVTMANAFNRANSVKCMMLMMGFSIDTHVFTYQNTAEIPEGKYSGGYVSDPTIKGFNCDRAIEELDVQSLYPSIMRAFNIGTDKLITRADLVPRYTRRGIVFNYRLLTVGQETFEAWFAWHENIPRLMGIMPAILEDLFHRRRALKKELGRYEDEQETIMRYRMRGGEPTENEQRLLDAESDIDFKVASIDTTQAAVKVYMNTFYGVSGSKQMPVYNVRVAASVTSWGVELIKTARARSEEAGYWYFYGDTDSLYIGAPACVLEPIVMEYSRGAITLNDYWYRIIIASQNAGDELEKIVDQLFARLSGTKTIKMSHDTTGFFGVISCKKKYAYLKQSPERVSDKGDTCPVMKYANKDVAEKVMKVKGMEIVKRGRTAILQDIGKTVLFRIFNPDTLIDLLNAGSYYDDETETFHTVQSAADGEKRFITRHAPEIPIGASVINDARASLALRDLRGLKPLATIDGAVLGVNDKLAIPSDRAIRRPPTSRDAYDLIYNVIYEEITTLMHSKWNAREFMKSAVYRMDDHGNPRKNPSVIAFVRRMQQTGGQVPAIGVRFYYVVVMRSEQVDHYGRVIKYKVGDLWEYIETVEREKLPINIPYYLKGEFTGMLGRFLTYRFPGLDEKPAFNMAGKLVVEITKQSSSFFAERETLRAQMRVKYLACRRFVSEILRERYGRSVCSAMDIEQLYKLINNTEAPVDKPREEVAAECANEDSDDEDEHTFETAFDESPVEEEPAMTEEDLLRDVIDATTSARFDQIRAKQPSMHAKQIISGILQLSTEAREEKRRALVAGGSRSEFARENISLKTQYEDTLARIRELIVTVPLPVTLADQIEDPERITPAFRDLVLARYGAIEALTAQVIIYRDLIQTISDRRAITEVICAI